MSAYSSVEWRGVELCMGEFENKDISGSFRANGIVQVRALAAHVWMFTKSGEREAFAKIGNNLSHT